MITSINEFKRILESKYDTYKLYQYNWSDYTAIIRYSRVFQSWNYVVRSVSNDYINFASDIDLQYDTPKESENAMFRDIENRIGSLPKSQFK